MKKGKLLLGVLEVFVLSLINSICYADVVLPRDPLFSGKGLIIILCGLVVLAIIVFTIIFIKREIKKNNTAKNASAEEKKEEKEEDDK